ncbi:hypothetical protein CH63R_12916 [Colletotrichum higginsianum IMI 349063]|uniref:Uncharacterized protein n=1 Tax=Colletotrichum higginsianum (strain IMI 349063) TaxID=759273 RepID=A0A1B7XVI0_COLHI|nr:hypothetical protein CH63R_12916 [Colletotrichum higginsianum IMI 349063]OBR03789.1 hypothetical protein CH63R_12916 [Colletotrichum higginsianum IMI 349063]
MLLLLSADRPPIAKRHYLSLGHIASCTHHGRHNNETHGRERGASMCPWPCRRSEFRSFVAAVVAVAAAAAAAAAAVWRRLFAPANPSIHPKPSIPQRPPEMGHVSNTNVVDSPSAPPLDSLSAAHAVVYARRFIYLACSRLQLLVASSRCTIPFLSSPASCLLCQPEAERARQRFDPSLFFQPFPELLAAYCIPAPRPWGPDKLVGYAIPWDKKNLVFWDMLVAPTTLDGPGPPIATPSSPSAILGRSVKELRGGRQGREVGGRVPRMGRGSLECLQLAGTGPSGEPGPRLPLKETEVRMPNELFIYPPPPPPSSQDGLCANGPQRGMAWRMALSGGVAAVLVGWYEWQRTPNSPNGVRDWLCQMANGKVCHHCLTFAVRDATDGKWQRSFFRPRFLCRHAPGATLLKTTTRGCPSFCSDAAAHAAACPARYAGARTMGGIVNGGSHGLPQAIRDGGTSSQRDNPRTRR